jgi:hypothetical protein
MKNGNRKKTNNTSHAASRMDVRVTWNTPYAPNQH